VSSLHRRRDSALASIALFTVLPVPVSTVDATRGALRWCPLSGCLVAACATGVAAAASRLYPGDLGALLAATITLAAAAAVTRGIHLDGLADTADGLGPLAGRQRALSVMRQPDIGPFGVAALVFVLLLQIAALARALEVGRGLPAVAESVLVGRLAMMRAGMRGIPPARPDGLGATVAGTVPGALVGAFAAALAFGAAVPALLGQPALAWHLLVALPAGMAAAEFVLRRAVGALGGVTGDVFGAVCEVATTATLLAIAVG
jgi:adenosylcobinamide-GDP ribazoletransferase